MNSDISEYLEDEIVKYIKHELKHGYSLRAIKHSLLYQGHKDDAITKAVSKLKKEKFKVKKEKRKPVKDLDEKSLRYVSQSIKDYIKDQKKKGYKERDIKKVLINLGHTRETINNAINEVVEQNKELRETKTFVHIKFFICYVLIIAFLLWVTASTREEFIIIFLGMSLSVIILFAFTIFIEEFKDEKFPHLLLIAVVLSLLFFFVGKWGNVYLLTRMELGKVTLLNFTLSLIFIVVLTKISRREERRRMGEERPTRVEKEIKKVLGKEAGEPIEKVEKEIKKAVKSVTEPTTPPLMHYRSPFYTRRRPKYATHPLMSKKLEGYINELRGLLGEKEKKEEGKHVKAKVHRLAEHTKALREHRQRLERELRERELAEKKKKEEDKTYIVSETGEKFHRQSCIIGKKIPRDKRIFIKGKKAAEKEGYRPCRVCHPEEKG